MIRLVVIAAIVALVWFVLFQLFRQLRSSNVDWTGVVAAIGFVVMAFWLRHVTGMG